jgi:DNA-binding HxlR family transcriptional regulator
LARKTRSKVKDPALETIRRIGLECRMIVIIHLLIRPMRFHELARLGMGIDPKTLTRVLKYFVSEEIIQRNVLSTSPFAVEYSLTEKGRNLGPVIDSLREWGENWADASRAGTKD